MKYGFDRWSSEMLLKSMTAFAGTGFLPGRSCSFQTVSQTSGSLRS